MAAPRERVPCTSTQDKDIPTPEALLDLIEQKGQEVAAALACLQATGRGA